MKLTFGYDDESYEIYLDDNYIGVVNHDDFDWMAMKKVRQLLVDIAEVAGWEVGYFGRPCI